jgi:putative tryptophan/tyrosine transport system substrate-binding protein
MKMKRRAFLTLLGGAAAALGGDAQAQESNRVRRIGIMMGYAENDPDARMWVADFVQGLAQLGWIAGKTARIDTRWATGNIERMQPVAKELVALEPDVLLAGTTPATAALQRETRTLPIVFVNVSDPVGAGFVAGFPRPGGNITGFTNVEASMGGKWLELLKEIAPATRKAAMMFNPDTAPGRGAYFLDSFEAAARVLGIAAISTPVRNDRDIAMVLSELGQEPGGGLILQSDAFVTVNRPTIITLAASHRVPAVWPSPIYPRDGGLLGYGQDSRDIFRRAAPYIDRILRGQRPADLPVQAPVKFLMSINVNTAKALGLVIPLTSHIAADEVIE